MRSLRAIVKFLRVLAWLVHGYWLVRVVFPKGSDEQQARGVEVWARGMLAIIGIQVRVKGHPAQGPVLMAANHISWLDILVMHAACHCRFVAKSEIRSWPLVGALTTGSGSLYIERSSNRDALRVVHQMAEALQQGQVLAVFPEGGTSDGITLLPFHANLLQAAISADAPIQPIALQFFDTHTHEVSVVPCYRDDDTLLSSFWRTLCAPPLLAQVRYGDKQYAQGRNRRDWAQDLQATVADLRT
jgi:1-acyl-sn-glycerol-3-phosphate acyltransferase